MEIINFTNEFTDAVFDIQQKAYKPLFDKYQDTETNPYMETKEKVLEKYTRLDTYGYVFIEDNKPIGSVRIAEIDNDTCHVSTLAVLPEYQNKGIAQYALTEIEKIHSYANTWRLNTIMQESANIHLYEKLGYVRTGEPKMINDKLTLVDYIKQK